MKVKIINKSINPTPKYATSLSAGMDIMADLLSIKTPILFNAFYTPNTNEWESTLTIRPGGRVLIPTGLSIELPEGYEAQIRPRSGLALKHGVTVLNSPGTIDADYRGDIGVILINHGNENFVIKQGDRIAQMVITQHATIEWEEEKVLSKTERGEGGFGSTGIEAVIIENPQNTPKIDTAKDKIKDCGCKNKKK